MERGPEGRRLVAVQVHPERPVGAEEPFEDLLHLGDAHRPADDLHRVHVGLREAGVGDGALGHRQDAREEAGREALELGARHAQAQVDVVVQLLRPHGVLLVGRQHLGEGGRGR